MKKVDDKPATGPKDLGVRVAPEPNFDVEVDEAGMVGPGGGGMSVLPDWRLALASRIPKRLAPLFPGAAGSNSVWCWRLGEGPFEADAVATGLQLSPDHANEDGVVDHGVVEPESRMPLQNYLNALEATRDSWRVDET